MKQLKIIAFMLCGLLLATSAQAAQRNLAVTAAGAQEQKRVALVIGNAAYQGAPTLRNPVNDAHAMSDALNKLGFQVIEITDASQKEMNRAIAEFGSKLNAETAALFFYAGHGLQVKNKNYLVPVDAQINGEAAVRAETVDVDTVMDQLNVSSLSIVILDACRNNPFERSFRKMGGGLAQMDAPKGSFIAYATAPGKTAADGDGKNGLFTQELLKQINTPGLSLEGVFKRVRANVSKTTGDAQMPWDSSSMTGDFYFKPGDGTQIASLVPVPAQPARIKSKEEIEQDTWDSARDSNDIDAVNEYLKQYPKGRFAGQARVLITTLKKSPAKPIEPVSPPVTPPARDDGEIALWTEVQKGNSADDYNAYLSQYPKGKYIALAKSRINKLQEEAANEAARKEQDAWEAAGKSENEDGYRSYLKGWPTGQYAGLAQVRLRKLQADLAAARQKKLEEEAAQQAKQEREAAARQEAERQRQQAEAAEAAKGPAMVRIPGRNFEMGKYDVTRGEFAKFVSETGYDAGNDCYVWNGSKWNQGGNWRSPGFSQDDSHPVTCVNWNDAQAYVSWLSKKTGKQYRLPNEAEWEYACYGGSQTEYCGGNDINSVAWYNGNSGNTTHPVGQKQANGYGLYDMSGNVWQWMENRYDDKNDWRALRGGSWNSEPQIVRAAHRNFYGPARRYGNYGFRLARTLP